MKRLRVIRQVEEYYEVPDDFELNEITFKELSPTVQITLQVQVASVSTIEPYMKENSKNNEQIQELSVVA